MTGPDLEGLYVSLDSPRRDEEISAVAISERSPFRVGRLRDGAAALVFAPVTMAGGSEYGVRMRHIEYAPSVEVDLEVGRVVSPRCRVAVLSCRGADPELRRYFFRVVAGLIAEVGAQPDGSTFDRAVRGLLELFDALSRAGRLSAQGLWAELCLIANSSDPGYAVRAWHTSSDDLFDFADEPYRLEVKSTTGQTRSHTVNLEQLRRARDGETVLASLLLVPSDEGKTLGSLLEQIGGALVNAPGQQRRIERIVADGLGASWREGVNVRYDASAALASLRFFRASQVPSVPTDLPREISEVHFRVDFSGLAAMSIEELQRESRLFSALVPAAQGPLGWGTRT